MNLAIMQPYFFPYLGYFQLMASVDEWVIFDDVQFVNKGWVNRNRILHPSVEKEWSYITVPLSAKNRFDRITDIYIADTNWRTHMRGQLSFLRKRAPFFKESLEFFDFCIDHDNRNLACFLAEALRRAASILQINPVFHVYSQARWNLSTVEHSGQWALRIAEVLRADRYLNPASGEMLFSEEEFSEKGIELVFHRPTLKSYYQGDRSFVPGLSILDVLMWQGLDGTRRLIREGAYEFAH